MAKQGMKRPEVTHVKPKNEAAAVPEISGRAKTSKQKANPIIAGTSVPSQKVYHSTPHITKDKPISKVYSTIDTNLARDNFENDIPFADLQDL